MKRLVAYFSASGVTKKLAYKLKDALDADIFEIEPKVLYSDADLNWMDKNSRSSIEMKNKDSRPEIKETIDTKYYDIIYVGFPIWWYQAPTIINTFLESIDTKNKKIVPFATSGGSQMGNTNFYLKNSVEGATLLDGLVINSSSSFNEFVSKYKF